MVNLSSRLDAAIGGKTAKALDRAFGMQTVADLLRHYPRRIDRRGELTDLAGLRVDDDVTVLAQVQSVQVLGAYDRAKQRLVVSVGDGKGELDLVFFGGRNVHWRREQLRAGQIGLFSGRVGVFRNRRQLVHPDYLLLGERALDDARDELTPAEMRALIPVYPATKDVRSWTVDRAVQHVLSVLDPVPEPLPVETRARRGLMTLDAALRQVHQPEDLAAWHRARTRLKWDEALAAQLVLAQRRAAARVNPAESRPARPDGLLAAFDARLPFVLTAGQREVGATLAEELSQQTPMQRLLQGDVGSGKTIVALRAMLQVVDAGGQAAMLAPTEVLATQHARTLEALLGPLGQAGRLGAADRATRVTLLTGSLSAPARRQALLDVASGAAGIVVGTHALLEERVQFADLGLVVVDEQHRFGVEQRDALRNRSARPPHVLVMTATPIPRTVAMTVFGDLETSVLRELPAGRSPIATSVVPSREKPAWLDRAWQRVREEVDAGRQAYVVVPRIGTDMSAFDAQFAAEEEELAELAELFGEDEPGRRPPLALADVLPMLRDGALAGLRIAGLHGSLAPDEKDRVMSEFAAGGVDVLVATTVVEVGVDVPNATVMVVLDADRFGVSQLHQLRGRVGRGSAPGLCLLVTEAPPDTSARERLTAVAATTDGFELARLDVRQRREGDVLGAAQSGRRSQFSLLSLLDDEEIIAGARAEAADLVAADPDLAGHPGLADQVAALVDDERAHFLDKT